MVRLDRIYQGRWMVGVVAAVVAALIIGLWLLSWYWTLPPAPLSPQASSETNSQKAAGVTTVNAVIDSIDVMLNKPGGYLSNDVMPPGVMMDNMPSWEYGALVQLRDFTHVLRNQISRSQAQSAPQPALSKAEPKLSVDNSSWKFPSSEDAYSEAIKHLKKYRDRLVGSDEPEAEFYARADNLSLWLQVVSRRLGGLSHELALAGGQKIKANSAPIGSPAPVVNGASQSGGAGDRSAEISWWQADNVYYKARGACWALLNLARAIEVDFHDVLTDKKALSTFKSFEEDLEATQKPIYTPMIFTGDRFGMFANHPLAMAAFTASANPTVLNLINLLEH